MKYRIWQYSKELENEVFASLNRYGFRLLEKDSDLIFPQPGSYRTAVNPRVGIQIRK